MGYEGAVPQLVVCLLLLHFSASHAVSMLRLMGKMDALVGDFSICHGNTITSMCLFVGTTKLIRRSELFSGAR